MSSGRGVGRDNGAWNEGEYEVDTIREKRRNLPDGARQNGLTTTRITTASKTSTGNSLNQR